jgi:phosphatidylglycerophosphate synthase
MSTVDRAHAVVMLLGIAATMWTGQLMVLSLTAVGLFAARIVWQRKDWQAVGAFGPANMITAVRVVMIASLAALPAEAPTPWAGIIVFATFVLDGVDGALARRSGITSAFGSQFDQEADAFTVAAATLLAFLCELIPVWFIVPGLLRYTYVLAVWILGAPREAARSRWGRWAYSAFVTGLIALLTLPATWTQWLAGLGTAALVASFSRSYWDVIRDARARR